MNYFSESNVQIMVTARERLHTILKPAADSITKEIPSFEGFALFQQDTYHPDSAGAIAQFNAGNISTERLAFQNNHIVNRRVDLEVSTLGQTFQTGSYQLEESRMNPHEHLVAGIHIPESIGKRAASVFQLAFTRGDREPSSEQLKQILNYWKTLESGCLVQLEALHQQAELYPTRSVADALELDVPTTPNAFIIGWDTSGSRVQARDNYGKLRNDLTLRGQQFNDIVESYGGKLMRPTGDGQVFKLTIPSTEYNRLSDSSIGLFAYRTLIPMVRALRDTANSDGRPPVRFTVELGRVEKTTYDESSPTIFDMATISDEQPHDSTTASLGNRALNTLEVAGYAIDTLLA